MLDVRRDRVAMALRELPISGRRGLLHRAGGHARRPAHHRTPVNGGSNPEIGGSQVAADRRLL